MPDESTVSHPYAAVLADLKAQRDKLDVAIAAIEALSANVPASAAPSNDPNAAVDGPGAFLGMSITDAAKKLLAARRQPLKNPEIAAAFKLGGLHLQSKDPVNTVGAVLSRRAQEVGDIVKIGRGTWGLKEWYPGRSFKTKPDNGDKAGTNPAETLEERLMRQKKEREAAGEDTPAAPVVFKRKKIASAPE
jgi:hypothetical protein